MRNMVGATFDPATFDHIATYNQTEHRIEIRLRSNREQTINVPGLDLSFTLKKGRRNPHRNQRKIRPSTNTISTRKKWISISELVHRLRTINGIGLGPETLTFGRLLHRNKLGGRLQTGTHPLFALIPCVLLQ